MKQRVFVIQSVPASILSKSNASQAAYNFCRKLIDVGIFDYTLSIVPADIKICSRDCVKDDAVEYLDFRIFEVLRFVKYISVLVNDMLCVLKCASANKIWFYNITKTNFLAYVILRFLLRKSVFVIIADHSPNASWWSLSNCMEWVLAKASGIISLSSRAYPLNENLIVIPGIESFDKKMLLPRKNKSPRKSFLFSGLLSNVTGIEMALKIFSKTDAVDLIVTGKKIDLVEEYALAYQNIKYLGFLEYDEYLDVLKSVDYCLSFRDPSLAENIYNFPSKVIEYMAYGKSVISTIVYPELDGMMYHTVSFDECEIMALIKRLSFHDSIPAEGLLDNIEKIHEHFSLSTWASSIVKIEGDSL